MIGSSFIKRHWKFIAVSLLCIAIVLGAVPLYFGWAFDPDGKFKLGDFGSWLQGSLTPLAIAIAAVALMIQFSAQSSTNAAQAEANKHLLMGIMLENIRRLEGRLNYLAAAAHYGQRVPEEWVQREGHLGFIKLLLDPPIDLDNPCVFQPSESMSEFEKELKRIIRLAKASDTFFLLDHRIISVHELLCCQPDSHKQGRKGRL